MCHKGRLSSDCYYLGYFLCLFWLDTNFEGVGEVKPDMANSLLLRLQQYVLWRYLALLCHLCRGGQGQLLFQCANLDLQFYVLRIQGTTCSLCVVGMFLPLQCCINVLLVRQLQLLDERYLLVQRMWQRPDLLDEMYETLLHGCDTP
ncbi:hypothetical protein SS50377_20984 [Spironucleus salmonicida]|uniref:Uncharacterized protein n=1 Tax=Spironucleus salmonicida TaxID=348837 RepID=A0A9P8M0C8_9EUKA|nr:hypothetical protein SS50377_20977 [Spironucleus salmonicida]KAH0577630.1 hypothetical protein SS50377_20984 [Spironucleus salmonicida]